MVRWFSRICAVDCFSQTPIYVNPRLWKSPMKEGYLVKQGHIIKSWKKRWFVLQNDMLFYFESPNDEFPIDFIQLSGCEIAIYEQKQFTIKLATTLDPKIFYLSGKSKVEIEQWIQAIGYASTHDFNPYEGEHDHCCNLE